MRPQRGSPLAVLHRDPVVAERKYGELRAKLILFFRRRKQTDAEDLADEVLFRAFARLREDPSESATSFQSYALTIARYLLRERLVRSTSIEAGLESPDAATIESLESYASSTETASDLIRSLPPTDRRLLLDYFASDRKLLAKSHGITPANLRLRVYRILAGLRRSIRSDHEEYSDSKD